MLKVTKTISVTGRSTVTEDEKEVVALTMSANISEDGTVSINKFIQNRTIYKAHKADVDADYEEFETYVEGLMEV